MPHASKAGGYINVKTSYAENAAMESIPGSRWRPKENVFRCHLSMLTCYSLRATFGERLTIDDNLAAWAKAEDENWIRACNWLTNPSVLELPPSSSIGPSTLHDAVAAFEAVDARCNLKLKPYQAVASVLMVLAKGAINASQMGTGKTPTGIVSLMIAQELFERGAGSSPFPALIVCPNGLKKNWARELDKWFPLHPYVIIKGTASQKKKQLAQAESDGRTVIINYESLRSFSRLAPYGSIRLKRCEDCGGLDQIKPAACEVHVRELNNMNWATVIADEAHRILEPKSKQSRALEATAKQSTYRWAMTGSLGDEAADLWPILHFVAPREFPSRTAFIERYIIKFYDPFGGMSLGGLIPEFESELRKILDARMIRHTKDQVLPFLPKKQYEIRTHELKREERVAYNALKKGMIADVDGGQVIAWNPMVQVGRLLQMAASTVQVEEDGTVTPCEPSSKLDAVEDARVNDYAGEPIPMFFESLKLLKLYQARLDKLGVKYVCYHGEVNESDRDLAIQAFQNGEVDYILLTSGAGGEGITLTRARVGFLVQRPWSLIRSQQTEDRWHRVGSEIHEFVRVVDFIAEDTAELDVRDTLVEKGEDMEKVLQDKNRVRALLG